MDVTVCSNSRYRKEIALKFAFMAQTAYQLMNMIKFVYNNTEQSRGDSIIFISNKVSSKLENQSILTESGLFKQVIIFCEKQYKEDKIIGKLDTVLNVINRESFGKLIIDRSEYREVEIVVIPSVSLESQIFWQYIVHRKIYLIEDGLGSITGNILLDGMRSNRRLLTKLLYGSFVLDKMYVNNRSFNNSEANTEFEEIPGTYDKDICALFKKIFLPSQYVRTYKDSDIVYLQQPIKLWNFDYIKLEKSIIQKCVERYNERFIIRCHPLTVMDSKIENVRYDMQNYAWETVCIDQITDNSVLMGVFSTAQFSPKQLFNREPHVIFMHKIIKPTNISQEKIENMIEVLLSNYSSTNKIHIPNSQDELLNVLESITHVQ